MRWIGAATVAAVWLLAGSSQADMNDAFGNTIVSHYPDGHWVKHWFDRDGRYSAHFWDGRRLEGRWTIEGDRVCLSHMRPRMILPRFCTAMVEADIGDTWQSRDPLGRRVRNVLVAGRED